MSIPLDDSVLFLDNPIPVAGALGGYVLISM